MKDWLTAKILKAFLKKRISRYATVTSIVMDSAAKTIVLTLKAHGDEKETILRVNQYTVREESGRVYVRVESSAASRLWISNLLEDHLLGRTFEIPKAMRLVL